MALKANIFTEDYNHLIERLANLNHYHGVVEWQLERARAGIARDLKQFRKRGWDPDAYFAGHGLSLINVFHDGRVIIRAPVAGQVTQGDDVLVISEEMQRRFNSFVLVSVFEAFEDFLKRVFGKFLFQLRGAIGQHQKRMFYRSNPEAKSIEGTPGYFDAYSKWLCRRDCESALAAFGEHLKWNRVLFSPLFGMGFDETVKAIGFCRHCIVHDEGRVSEKRFRKLMPVQQAFVKKCLHNSLHGNDVLILPPTAMLDRMFEGLISYAWALFVLLAERCRMRDDSQYFRNPETGKRRVKPN